MMGNRQEMEEELYKLMYTCETLYGSDIMPLMEPYTSIEYHKYYVKQTRQSITAQQSGIKSALTSTAKGIGSTVLNGISALLNINEGYVKEIE